MKQWWRTGHYRLWADRGSAMLVALFTIVILLLVGATAVNLAHLEGMIAKRHVEYLQVSYLAESGIAKARAMIYDDPRVLTDPGTRYLLEIDQPELRGEVVVTVTQPSLNGLLTIKSNAQLPGGAKKIWQATTTAPPDYELYCGGVQLNPTLNIVGLLQAFGIEYQDPIPVLEGELQVDPLSQGAYQEFAGDAGYFSVANHTHRYQPPAVEIDFWRQAANSDVIDWSPYTYHFFDDDITLPPTLGSAIYAVNGDVLIYSAEEPLALQNCMVIAKGDIWIVNLGDSPSNVTGLYLAGRDVNLYQAANDMEVRANLCAGQNVNLCCGGASNYIYLGHPENRQFVRGAPRALRGKLGFLSIKSYQELAN